MKTVFSITVTLNSGASILHAISDAVRMARIHHCNVEFRHNDLLLRATPQSSEDELYQKWIAHHDKLKEKAAREEELRRGVMGAVETLVFKRITELGLTLDPTP